MHFFLLFYCYPILLIFIGITKLSFDISTGTNCFCVISFGVYYLDFLSSGWTLVFLHTSMKLQRGCFRVTATLHQRFRTTYFMEEYRWISQQGVRFTKITRPWGRVINSKGLIFLFCFHWILWPQTPKAHHDCIQRQAHSVQKKSPVLKWSQEGATDQSLYDKNTPCHLNMKLLLIKEQDASLLQHAWIKWTAPRQFRLVIWIRNTLSDVFSRCACCGLTSETVKHAGLCAIRVDY